MQTASSAHTFGTSSQSGWREPGSKGAARLLSRLFRSESSCCTSILPGFGKSGQVNGNDTRMCVFELQTRCPERMATEPVRPCQADRIPAWLFETILNLTKISAPTTGCNLDTENDNKQIFGQILQLKTILRGRRRLVRVFDCHMVRK